jgi:nucleoside-diphosphate-sugar epimerase
MNKNALVTGGAGFIGSNVVKELINNGINVTVIDDLSSGYKENLISNAKFINVSINKINEVQFYNSFDYVFHLAASVGRQKSIDNPEIDSSVNLLGTVEMLKFIRNNKIPKIIYSSSAAIYGELQKETIDENHPLNADSPYGVSKLAAEKMIFAFSGLYGFDAVALRYFNVYGINQRFDFYGNVIPIFLNQINQNKPVNIYGDGNQTRDFLNVKDVVKANIQAALKPNFNGFYNLGSGESISINQLVDILEKIYDKKIIRNYLPKRIGDVMHCKANINKIKKGLNFTPNNDIMSGLIDYVKWFKNQK